MSDTTRTFDPQARLAEAVAGYARAAEAGESVDRQEWLARYPDVADGLAAYFARRARAADKLAGLFRDAGVPAAPPGERAGTLLSGRYELIEPIGEGGMGAVWLAEQSQPVRRRVAVKLIREGMDTRQVLARFAAERQALAVMDHPHIAKVLDAGSTDAGRPYFVMELVRGVPLTAYCDRQKLSVPQRLDLFRHVCSAVQHAHQKGVIHRDLKPGNILVEEVDGVPVPKVIDFGLAKALGGRPDADDGPATVVGSVLGTPLYMAPEQATFDPIDVDTRADVYALGVVLYELLTGTTPLDRERLARAALDEVLRAVREDDPPRPSARRTASGPRADELDWIVMKALAKERDRRYESATALADDVGRFLRDEPVAAGPPSAAYRARKFLRRHRGPAAAAAAVLAALVAGVCGTTWGMFRANAARRAEAAERQRADDQRAAAVAERDRATQAEERAKAQTVKAVLKADEAKAVLGFLEEFLFKAARPVGRGPTALGPGVTLRAAVEATEPWIAVKFRNQPLVEASLRSVIGGTYMWLRQWDRAIPQHERAVALRRERLGDLDPATLQSVGQLVRCYARTGDRAKAVTLADALVGGWEGTPLNAHAAARPFAQLADLLVAAGRTDRAVAVMERVHREWLAGNRPASAPVALAKAHLAAVYLAADRPADALPLARDAAAAYRGRTDVTVADLRVAGEALADAAVRTGRPADAEAGLRAYVAAIGEKRGERSPDLLRLKVRLADVLLEQNRPADAVAELEPAHRLLAARHPDEWATADAKSILGAAVAATRRGGRAERLLTDGFDALKWHAADDPVEVPRWRLERAYDRVAAYYKAGGNRNKLRAWEARRYEAYREAAPPPRPAAR